MAAVAFAFDAGLAAGLAAVVAFAFDAGLASGLSSTFLVAVFAAAFLGASFFVALAVAGIAADADAALFSAVVTFVTSSMTWGMK